MDSLEDEADGELSNSLPLNNELKLCSDLLAIDDDETSFLENGMEDPSTEPSCSKEDPLAWLANGLEPYTEDASCSKESPDDLSKGGASKKEEVQDDLSKGGASKKEEVQDDLSKGGASKKEEVQEDLSKGGASKKEEDLSKGGASKKEEVQDDLSKGGASKKDHSKGGAVSVEEDDDLRWLGVSAYDHTQLEEQVLEQVREQEERRRVEDASKELRAVEEDIRFVKQRLGQIEKAVAMAPRDLTKMTSAAKRELSAIKMEKENKLKHLKKIEAKRRALQVCISGSADQVSSSLQGSTEVDEDLDEETLSHLRSVFASKTETEEERLIRTGEMTPFGSISVPQEPTDFDRFLATETEAHRRAKRAKKKISTVDKPNRIVVKNDKDTGFHFTDVRAAPPSKKRSRSQLLRIQKGNFSSSSPKKRKKKSSLVQNYQSDSEISDHQPAEEEEEVEEAAEEEYSDEDVYVPEKESTDEEEFEDTRAAKGKKKAAKKSGHDSDENFSESESPRKSKKSQRMKKLADDGDQASFIKRIKEFEMAKLKEKHRKIMESDEVVESDDEETTELEEGFKIPNFIWDKLYKYQQTCVQWLWELHRQQCGGIVGDEMGLGKTVQVIAFFAGLHCSHQRTEGDSFRGLGPVILVCPTTVMHQWVKEFHTWWPPFRVAILHDSGSFTGGNKDVLISTVNRKHGILITSYAGVVHHQDSLLAHEWHYVVLDEGHKIRNPDAQATIAVKRFRTCHRLVLSGSPVQNNLRELWSLFDFVFPGKLGTLPVFMQQFSVPIVQGGYANATQMQVQTAYKCATVLRDAIKPYLLRRMKSDVKMNINLPNKSEQVLFCQLTEEQVDLYKGYINSKEVGSILDSRLQVFVGLVNLRKICNHPDLFDGGPKIFKDTDVTQLGEEERFGYPGRSGKMRVVEALLRLWHQQGHRVLLFTQSRQMMDILELFVKSREYSYMKMDGTTPISSRQPAINKFNSDPSVFVFLLTTRVGGLGVNLTGADRVILYDPDWNPSTDAQARERAWRIGQKRQVTVYRLLTAGTIEEKIYHRQIFKQFVTNRVLKDPRQRRFFKSNDLFELFTYNDLGTQGTETSAIFAGTGSEVRPKKNPRRPTKHREEGTSKEEEDDTKKNEVSFSDEKREQMKLLAKKLAMQLTGKIGASPETTKNSTEPKPVTKEKSNEGTASKDKKEKSSKDGTPSKHRRKKAAKVEGEKIVGVVKKSVYKPPQDEEERNRKEDDYVLSKLFKTSGVHTALRHDAIVDSSAPDYMIVEGEAQRVANEAVRALRESRAQCRRAEEGVPTFTGSRKPLFGRKKRVLPGSLAGRDSPSPKFQREKKRVKFDGRPVDSEGGGQCSSDDLLSAIRRRNVVFGTDVDPAQTTAMSTTEHDALLADILSFVAFQASEDGRATTREILARFKEKVPPRKSAIFKAMLKRICTFTRTPQGEGQWRLREEFR